MILQRHLSEKEIFKVELILADFIKDVYVNLCELDVDVVKEWDAICLGYFLGKGATLLEADIGHRVCDLFVEGKYTIRTLRD